MFVNLPNYVRQFAKLFLKNVYFRHFFMTQIKFKLIKGLMACLGLEPGATGR